MTKTMPPTASDVPKKERRLIARFGGLGFDIDVVNNNAESLIIGFMIGESHRCRIMADEIKLPFSYLFNLWIIEGCIKPEGRTATPRAHTVLPLTLKFQLSSDRTSARDEYFMIGDFIRRGQRGRAVSTEGLTSHRTQKNFANETLYQLSYTPTMACKLA